MKEKNNFKIFYVLSFAWQLGFLIAIPLCLFVFLGYLADNFFRTSPLFIISGTLLGITVTIYEVYHQLMILIKEKDND